GWAALGVVAGVTALLCAEVRHREVLRERTGPRDEPPAAPPVLLVAGMAAAMTAAGLAALVLLL
ncbi:MAG: hypothetical protein M3P96_13450, partial [Actinomycetota bacterium]|nr:hypothetical protein [Actinomycetota bacterium]